MAKPRRRSNSFADQKIDHKSKFEMIESDPVFDERIHGASAIAEEEEEDVASLDLDKSSSTSSGESSFESIGEDDALHHK
jgi:hypothetical protein